MNKKLACAFLLVLLLFAAGCVPQSPQVTYQRTDVGVLSLTELSAKSSFTVKNPNAVSLQGTAEYDLFVKGSKLLSGKSSVINLEANGQTAFTIDSRVDLIKIFGAAAELIKEVQAGKTSVPFEIKGKFKTDVAGIFPVEAPVSASGELPLPTLADLLKIYLK